MQLKAQHEPGLARRWKRVVWAATGIAWALLFFAGADQVASNTFIERRSDGSAATDALFHYVAIHHSAIGVLLVTLAIANVLFVLFGVYLASLARPSAKPTWMPMAIVVLAALGTVPFWFADIGTASIWFAAASGAEGNGYRWISPTIDRLLPIGGPSLIVYIGLVAYTLRRSKALPSWVTWFSWAVALVDFVFSALAISAPTTGAFGAIAFISVLLWMLIVSSSATWSAGSRMQPGIVG